jgi:hypothetical protein
LLQADSKSEQQNYQVNKLHKTATIQAALCDDTNATGSSNVTATTQSIESLLLLLNNLPGNFMPHVCTRTRRKQLLLGMGIAHRSRKPADVKIWSRWVENRHGAAIAEAGRLI